MSKGQTKQRDYLTPEEFAKATGHGKPFVLRLIAKGQIEGVRDERGPGSSRPRYRLPLGAVRAWQQSCVVAGPGEQAQTLRSVPRLVGIFRSGNAPKRGRPTAAAAPVQTP